MNTAAKFEPNMETGVLYIERTFQAPVAKVWTAWTDAGALKAWWGPRTWPATHSEMDFRVGGYWLYCMTGPNGEQSWGKFTYEEIEEPTRLVYQDNFCNDKGEINEDMPTIKTQMTFEDLGNGTTRMVSIGQYATPADLQKVLDMGMEAGYTETCDRLDEYLAKEAK